MIDEESEDEAWTQAVGSGSLFMKKIVIFDDAQVKANLDRLMEHPLKYIDDYEDEHEE